MLSTAQSSIDLSGTKQKDQKIDESLYEMYRRLPREEKSKFLESLSNMDFYYFNEYVHRKENPTSPLHASEEIPVEVPLLTSEHIQQMEQISNLEQFSLYSQSSYRKRKSEGKCCASKCVLL